MDLRWFEDVVVLLEERNMTRAAERRNITQPAFSRRIRSFEHWLGTPLLERKANNIRIHPSLLANEDEIRSLIARIRELKGRVTSFRPEREHVTITIQHALLFSSFPDLAQLTRQKLPEVRFRLRAGNRTECVSLFLRNEASILLCYECEHLLPMPFDNTVHRDKWGHDRLVPVVGGKLRYERTIDGAMPDGTPAIIYPEQSYFGELLADQGCRFATQAYAANPGYETAYSAGIKEMVVAGLGIGWLPMSMVYRQIESGTLLDLSANYGSVPLEIVFYTNSQNKVAAALRRAWVDN